MRQTRQEATLVSQNPWENTEVGDVTIDGYLYDQNNFELVGLKIFLRISPHGAREYPWFFDEPISPHTGPTEMGLDESNGFRTTYDRVTGKILETGGECRHNDQDTCVVGYIDEGPCPPGCDAKEIEKDRYILLWFNGHDVPICEIDSSLSKEEIQRAIKLLNQMVMA